MLNAVKQEEDSMKAYSLGLYEKSMPSDLTWREKLQAAKDARYDYIELTLENMVRIHITDKNKMNKTRRNHRL